MHNELNKNIRLLNPYANLDERYGTYPNTQVANNSIPISVRKPGLTVGIEENETVVEYWYNGGINNSNLVLKVNTSENQGPAGGSQNLQQVTNEGNTTTNDIVVGNAVTVTNQISNTLGNVSTVSLVGSTESTTPYLFYNVFGNSGAGYSINLPDFEGDSQADVFMTSDPLNNLPSVRVNKNEWRHQHSTNTVVINDDYVVQSEDYTLIFYNGTRGIDLTLPNPSLNPNRELEIIAGQNQVVAPNIPIYRMGSTLSTGDTSSAEIFNSSSPIQGSSSPGLQNTSLRIKSVNWDGSFKWLITSLILDN